MRILFICNQYLNGHGGGVYAARAYINGLATISSSITLLFPYKNGCDATGIKDNVNLVPVKDDRKLIIKALSMVYGHIHRFSVVAKEYAIKNKYDIVIFSTSQCSFGIIDLFQGAGIKCITLHHNYEYEYVRDNAPFYQRYFLLPWIVKAEREAVKKSDLNLVLTYPDQILLNSHYSSVKPFCVTSIFESHEILNVNRVSNKKRGYKFIITGNLGAMQTENSIIPWIKEYYPLLIERYPLSSLTIAGKNPSQRLSGICKDKKIILISNPSDMLPLLLESDYYICPIAFGGGIKLRISDGLKAGLPVITHIVSARGYENMIDLNNVFVYSDIDSFCREMSRMMKSNKSRDAISAEYFSFFSFSSGVNRIKSALHLIGY